MPRDDYEYFVKHWHEWKSADDYVLSVQSEEYIDYNLLLLCGTGIQPISSRTRKIWTLFMGVQLDILPLDGYPDSPKERKKQVFHALIYSLFCAQTIPENHGKFMAAGCRFLLWLFHGKKIRYKIWSKAKEKNDSL